MCVNAYHSIFAKYAQRSPKHVIDRVLSNDEVNLLARESLSRVTICHLRKLNDQGHLYRVQQLCEKYITDINQLIGQSVQSYSQLTSTFNKMNKGNNEYNSKLAREQNSLGNLKRFIHKLRNRRIWFESFLLRISCQRAQWQQAHKHFLRVHLLANNMFKALLKWKEIKTQPPSEILQALQPTTPGLSNRPLIHCIDYLVCYEIYSRAKFRKNDKNVLFSGITHQCHEKQLAFLLTSDNNHYGPDHPYYWFKLKTKTTDSVKTAIAEQRKVLKPEGEIQSGNAAVQGFKKGDYTTLSNLFDQYQVAVNYLMTPESRTNISERKSKLLKSLDSIQGRISPQMKLYLELEHFRIIISEMHGSEDKGYLKRHINKLKKMLMMLQSKGLTIWYIDALLICAELLYHPNIKEEYEHEREQTLIIANQLIEQTTYAYRELDLLMQQYPEESAIYQPMMIR